jgi:nitroreductase
MWDFYATVRNRHSIRRYQSDMPVEQEKLHAILETACAAPSAGDLQAYQIVVVTAQAQRDLMSRLANQQEFISHAPVLLVFCADTMRSKTQFGDRGCHLYAIQDATIACAYAQLAAVAAGLGSTWIGQFNPNEIAKALELESGLDPVAMLSLGYPAEVPELTPRRPMDAVVRKL